MLNEKELIEKIEKLENKTNESTYIYEEIKSLNFLKKYDFRIYIDKSISFSSKELRRIDFNLETNEIVFICLFKSKENKTNGFWYQTEKTKEEFKKIIREINEKIKQQNINEF